MLTIVVPFFNGHKFLPRLLDSLPPDIPLWIVDDLSSTPLADVGRPNTQVFRLKEKGYFTGAVNFALDKIDTDVLILNQDTYFENGDWLNLIEENKKEYALIGEGVVSHRAWPTGYIHGTFMFIRQDAIETLGQMDAEFYPLWGSTCDYQLKASRKGFKSLVLEHGKVPGFKHLRERNKTGESIQELLKAEGRRGGGKRGLFIRTPPLISVVINTYNHGRFLPDTVNSLIGGPTCLGGAPGQTFQSFEVIIVDDGSTDNTPWIGRKLAKPRQGIRYIRQENAGSAAAMNTGIKAAFGKYIAPLDADDMMKPGRLERMLRLQEKNPHSFIFDNVAYFSHVKDKWQLGAMGANGWQLTLPLAYDFERLLYKNGVHKGLMYPKEAWEDAGGYPEIMNDGREDWAFNVGLGIKGWCGVHTGEAEYLYRRSPSSRTLRNTTPKHRSRFLIKIQSIYPKIYEGERPVKCCGGGQPRVNKKGKAGAQKKSLPGKSGMVILRYIGKNAGNETWMGDKTRPRYNATYIFGGGKKVGYVDKEDAGWRPGSGKDGYGMLSIKENGKFLFTLEPEKKPKPPKPVEIKSVADEYAMAGRVIVIDPDLNPSLGGTTVAVLKDNLVQYPYIAQEIETALETETRKSAIKALEDAL